jgi:hypothetical protein
MDSHINYQPIRRRSALLLLVVFAIATSLLAAEPRIAPPGSMPQGGSYASWGAAWWQWVFSLHANAPLNPLRAAGDVDCSYRQLPNVWFLVGAISPGTTTRTCQVPAGTWLFFPVLNAWADNVAVSPPISIMELKAQAAYYAQASELHASVDGVAVKHLFAYRAGYAPFGYTVPDQDSMAQYFGADIPGKDWPTTFVFPAASDGYWLMLEPLCPGPHTINFGGTGKNTGFQIDITYNITVVPKGRP